MDQPARLPQAYDHLNVALQQLIQLRRKARAGEHDPLAWDQAIRDFHEAEHAVSRARDAWTKQQEIAALAWAGRPEAQALLESQSQGGSAPLRGRATVWRAARALSGSRVCRGR